jgi:hypothetical protein
MFASTERVELAALWDELVAGTTKVESWSHAEGTWSMVVSRRPDMNRPPQALRRRDVAILENTLLRGVRKHVAVEVGLSCSSIAVIMQTCFEFMGLTCLPSRIPGLLVAAAHARHHQAPKPQVAATGTGVERQVAQRTITVIRPDTLLAAGSPYLGAHGGQSSGVGLSSLERFWPRRALVHARPLGLAAAGASGQAPALGRAVAQQAGRSSAFRRSGRPG